MRFTTPYQPPSSPVDVTLDLSRNEGRAVDPSILRRVEQSPGLFNRYPNSDELRSRIAGFHGFDRDEVLITAGGDDALLRACSALLNGLSTAVTTTPTFEMIARYSLLQDAKLVEVPWKRQQFPVEEMSSHARGQSVCLVVSPNNPTGEVIGDEALRLLADSFDFVVLDGAYTEFGDVDLTPTARALGNVLMIRTLSKAWGLAGLRVGYLVAAPELVQLVAAHGNPYPVSRLSLAIALERVNDDDVDTYLTEVRRERLALYQLLGDLGTEPIRSQANFVFTEADDAPAIHQRLLDIGVAIRRFPGTRGMERAIRITLPGDPEEFGVLTTALSHAITKQTGEVTIR